MPNTKTKKVSIRFPQYLIDMIEELMPLYDKNFSKTVCAILIMFKLSQQQTIKKMTDRIANMRFELMLREAQLQEKFSKGKSLAKKSNQS